MLLYLIPLFVLGFLLVLFGTLVVLSRFRGGKYLRPIVAFASKVPILKRLIEKASQAAIERYNPELGLGDEEAQAGRRRPRPEPGAEGAEHADRRRAEGVDGGDRPAGRDSTSSP